MKEWLSTLLLSKLHLCVYKQCTLMMAMTFYVSLSPNRSSHGHNECNPVAEKPFSSDLKLSGSELKMIELSPCVMLCQCLKSFTDGSLFLPNRRIPEHSRHVWASGHRYQQRRHQQWKELGEDHTSQPGKEDFQSRLFIQPKIIPDLWQLNLPVSLACLPAKHADEIIFT